MTPESWTGVVGVISAIAAALSAVAVARINSTKTDVGVAKQQATAANDAAVEARELARPTGNGYADKTIGALDRIERRLEELTERQVRTNAWLTQHLSDHAHAEITNRTPPGGTTDA